MDNNFQCKICNLIENKYAKGLCKKCYLHKYSKKYYQKNKQKFLDTAAKRYKDNKKECIEVMKKYAEKNKDKIQNYLKDYYQKNKEKFFEHNHKYYKENKEELIRKGIIYKQNRQKTDVNYYLKEILSTRCRMAIKHHKGTKVTPAIELLGANIKIVREHIESQFEDGMSWDNHGEWHIDHIVPCASFDLTDVEQQKQCFHYANLQPLWAVDNIRKANKII